MRLYKKLIAVCLILTLALTMSSCSASNAPDQPDTAAAKTKTIKSTDGKIEVTVPDSWKEESLNNPDAVLQAADISKEEYILIITENTADFADDAKPSDYLTLVLENIKATSQNSEASELKDVKINGYDATHCEVTAEVEKLKIKYLLTVVKTDDQFLQVLAWSLNSLYDENKAEIESVVNSIQVVQ